MQTSSDSSLSFLPVTNLNTEESDAKWCLEERIPPDGEEEILPRMDSSSSLSDYDSLHREENYRDSSTPVNACAVASPKNECTQKFSSKFFEDSDLGSEATLDSCIDHSDGDSFSSKTGLSNNGHNSREYEYLRARLLASYRQEVAKCYHKLNTIKLRKTSRSIPIALKRQNLLAFPKISREYHPNIEKQNECVSNEVSSATENSPGSIPITIERPIERYLKFDGELPYKSYKVRQGHLEGCHNRILFLLTSHAIYLFDDEHPLKKIKDFIPYEDVEACIVSSNYLWLALIRKNIHSSFRGMSLSDDNQFVHIDIGDVDFATSLLSHLELAIRRRINKLLSIDDAQSAMSDDLKIELKSKMELLSASAKKLTRFFSPQFLVQAQLLPRFLEFTHEFSYTGLALGPILGLKNPLKIHGCWQVLWENGSLADMEESTRTLCGPHLEGHLMMRKQGILSMWRPAYFVLKAGVLYQFADSSHRLPESLIPIEDCSGCTKLSSNSRPHAFQLLCKKESSISLAAPDGEIASQWLQAFLTLINNKDLTVQEHALLPCQMILTNLGLVLCHRSNFLHLVYDAEKNLFSRLNQKIFKCQRPSRRTDLQNKFNRTIPTDGEVKEIPFRSLSLIRTNSVPSPTSSNLSSPQRKLVSKTGHQGASSNFSPLKHKTQAKLDSRSPSEICGPSGLLMRKFGPLDCPPTPPRLVLPPIATVNPPFTCKKQLSESFKILSTGYCDQINQVYTDPLCPEACIVEYECSEALEVVGDWAIYFRTSKQLQDFLKNLSKQWMPLGGSNKYSVNMECHDCTTKVPTQAVHNFLMKGSLTSHRMWNGC